MSVFRLEFISYRVVIYSVKNFSFWLMSCSTSSRNTFSAFRLSSRSFFNDPRKFSTVPDLGTLILSFLHSP